MALERQTEIAPERYTRSIRARRLRGVAVLMEMLEHIGANNVTDHDVAKVMVDNELELREMMAFTASALMTPDLERAR